MWVEVVVVIKRVSQEKKGQNQYFTGGLCNQDKIPGILTSKTAKKSQEQRADFV